MWIDNPFAALIEAARRCAAVVLLRLASVILRTAIELRQRCLISSRNLHAALTIAEVFGRSATIVMFGCKRGFRPPRSGPE
jgi:hypothetical protein